MPKTDVAQGPVDVNVRGRVVGHKTFRDGLGFRHEPLYESEAAAIIAQCEAAEAKRKELMPDEETAIRMLFDAYQRLKDFGWRDAIYCPKDGTTFKVIEAGSTEKHDCIYQGDWPGGAWWIVEDGDMCPSRPVLFKAPNAELNDARRASLEQPVRP
jgi:hypothetical protein